MRISIKSVLTELRDVLLLILLSVVLVLSGVACRQCNDDTRLFLIITSFTSVMWILLWKGNEFLAGFLSRKISWIEYPVRRFLIGFAVTVVYTLVVVFVLSVLFERFFNVYVSSTVVSSVIIALVISLFMHGRSFLENWRQASIEAERFERETIMARYESLKNQISPHFLFNSLNALTNLVYQDKTKASKFIQQLSLVYRYVLDTRDREVVSLTEEISFVRSYLFLQQIRFGDKLKLHIDVDDCSAVFVPPLSIQMLIENAIKHNVVSKDDPLTVRVFKTEGFAVVENNLQLKSKRDEHSSGVGLENIRRRYEILSKEKVLVEKDHNRFRVSIPLLQDVSVPLKRNLVKPVMNEDTID